MILNTVRYSFIVACGDNVGSLCGLLFYLIASFPRALFSLRDEPPKLLVFV